MPHSVMIRWLLTLALPSVILFGAWTFYKKHITQRDGQRVVATVVENDALFRKNGKDRSMVTIHVEVNGELKDLSVKRGDRGRYQLGAMVEARLDGPNGALVNTTNRYEVTAINCLIAGLGLFVLFAIGTVRYQKRISESI